MGYNADVQNIGSNAWCHHANKHANKHSKLWNIHHATAYKSLILTCDICKKTFSKPSAKQAHRNNHTSHKHCCTRCNKTFAYISALQQHKIVHSRQRFKCFSGKCTPSYKYPWDLNRHIKTHLNEEYKCSKCLKIFKQERLLKHHSVKHEDVFRYICPNCGHKTKWATPYKRHLSICKTHTS